MEKKNTYCPKTGLEGSERLLILNETYNPSTFDLISEWAKPGMRVLELGCGLGLISNHLAECVGNEGSCLLYTSPSPRDRTRSRMPSSA